MRQTLLTVAGVGYTILFDVNANNSDSSVVSLDVTAANVSEAYVYDPALVPDRHWITRHWVTRHWVTMTFRFTALSALTILEFDSTTTDPVFGPGLDVVRMAPAPDMALFFPTLSLPLS